MLGIIITNGFTFSKSTEYKVMRLIEEFGLLNVDIEVLDGAHSALYFHQGSFQSDQFKRYDFCIYLDKDRYLANAIEEHIPLFNSARAIELCDDKMLTYIALKNHGIRVPLTIPCPLNYSDDLSMKNVLDFFDFVESKLTYPLIVKQVYGSLGRQVYLIESRGQLEVIYSLLRFLPHIYQEYIDAEIGVDYRLLTVDSRVVASMRRANTSDFRSNIALGGVGQIIEPEKSFIELAEKASAILGLDYAGVDILKARDGSPVLNEVNSNAFFSEIEKATMINVTKIFCEHVIKSLAKRNKKRCD